MDQFNTVLDLLQGVATAEQLASHFQSFETDMLEGITRSLSSSDRVRELEEENRILREALLHEATLRADLLLHRRSS